MKNNLSYYIPQSQTGYGEWGLGGPHELTYSLLINRTERFGYAP